MNARHMRTGILNAKVVGSIPTGGIRKALHSSGSLHWNRGRERASSVATRSEPPRRGGGAQWAMRSQTSS
jgi:hypothetical protein